MINSLFRSTFTGFSIVWGLVFLSASLFAGGPEEIICNCLIFTCRVLGDLFFIEEIPVVLISLLVNSIMFGCLSVMLLRIMDSFVKKLEYKLERYRNFF